MVKVLLKSQFFTSDLLRPLAPCYDVLFSCSARIILNFLLDFRLFQLLPKNTRKIRHRLYFVRPANGCIKGTLILSIYVTAKWKAKARFRNDDLQQQMIKEWFLRSYRSWNGTPPLQWWFCTFFQDLWCIKRIRLVFSLSRWLVVIRMLSKKDFSWPFELGHRRLRFILRVSSSQINGQIKPFMKKRTIWG